MTWIKICGITNSDDALNACKLDIDALGFIFAESPRRIDPESARKIINILPNHIFKVGVFVDEEKEEVKRISKYCGLNILQFNGNELPDYCSSFSYPIIKAIRIKGYEDIEIIREFQKFIIMLDTYNPTQAGGTGKSFPWEIAITAKKIKEFILSGGLNPLNIKEAILKVKPWGVDVSSGVERVPRLKDFSKMVNFVMEVRSFNEEA